MSRIRGRHLHLAFEPLETRNLLAAGVTARLARGVLTVIGTEAADVITIDRKAEVLTAQGKVFTQTRERPKANAKQPQAQLFTLVRAPEMEYREADKVAHSGAGALCRIH